MHLFCIFPFLFVIPQQELGLNWACPLRLFQKRTKLIALSQYKKLIPLASLAHRFKESQTLDMFFSFLTHQFYFGDFSKHFTNRTSIDISQLMWCRSHYLPPELFASMYTFISWNGEVSLYTANEKICHTELNSQKLINMQNN